ncbi:glycosyltransferase family 2 protein [Candidatus Pacearchaeota archaeon]|nr:glycosyltransferase family 2 protein [Candidatus Pacearchaeota archaeon]
MPENIPVLICAYNEERNIRAIIANIRRLRIAGIELKPLVVDDGSTDNTAEEVQRAGAELIRLERNLGKAGAFFYGLQRISPDNKVFLSIDADVEGIQPEQIVKLTEPLQRGRLMTIGSVCGAMSALSGQRAYKTSALSTLLSPVYSNMLNADSKLRIGYGIEVLLNYVVSGFTDPLAPPRTPREIEFVATAFQCVAGSNTQQANHKLRAPQEVERTRKMCGSIFKR